MTPAERRLPPEVLGVRHPIAAVGGGALRVQLRPLAECAFGGGNSCFPWPCLFTRESHAPAIRTIDGFGSVSWTRAHVGSIPITRSNPSQVGRGTARTIRYRRSVARFAPDASRWPTFHTQPQFQCVTAPLISLTSRRARVSRPRLERYLVGLSRYRANQYQVSREGDSRAARRLGAVVLHMGKRD
jgi:hypothetical protein